jgi:hypothetical protein
MHPHYKLALLDISNLYSIIPRQSSPTHWNTAKQTHRHSRNV